MPVSVPPVRVAVMVRLVPVPVTVTLSVRWPLVKEPETLGLIVPAVVLRFTVPVKVVTVLFDWFCAVMVMLNGVLGVCGLLIAAMAKWSSTAISLSVPKFENPSVTPVITLVPDLVILPVANGLLAVGRTPIFCHVSELVTPEPLVWTMVVVSVFVVTATAMVEPFAR